jgi:hypothetical protein
MGAVLFSAGQPAHWPLRSHNNSIDNGQCNDQLKAIRIASATALKAE